MPTVKHVNREHNGDVFKAATQKGMTPVQAAILARRSDAFDSIIDESGIDAAIDTITNNSLSNCRHPGKLKDADKAAKRIAEAVINNERIATVNDFDCDGCTSSTVFYKAAVKYFRHPEDKLTTIIGNRFTDGYGLSDSIVNRILDEPEEKRPALVITTDCGSKDEPRISTLKDAGIDVIVTDHHEPPQDGAPPSAFAFVNPNQVGCSYGDNTIAGCGVIWLVSSYVRSYLIKLQPETYQGTPKLSGLLDYVALGTVADCVSLASPINRAFIHFGLSLINQRLRPCWQVAHEQLNQDGGQFSETDLGFKIGPRINARSRMCDASAAGAFLRADSKGLAERYYLMMNEDNEDRKFVESEMKAIAFEQVESKNNPYCSVAYHDSFHEGVQGIVASRVAEKFGKPTVVFSPAQNEPGVWKGSGRSVNNIALDKVFETIESLDKNTADPLYRKWGGHQGACGCSVSGTRLKDFEKLFTEAIQRLSDTGDLSPKTFVDGSLSALEPTPSVNTVAEIAQMGPYGQKYERPCWCERALIKNVRAIGSTGTHLKLTVSLSYSPEAEYDAVWFNAIDNEGDPLPFVEGDMAEVAFELSENRFRGNVSLQLIIKSAKRVAII